MKIFEKLPNGVKSSIGFFIANLVNAGIAYVTTPIYTRLLSAEEFGQTSLFLTWLQIFGIVAMFCLSYGVFNNGMLDYPEHRDEYSFSMLILSNIITVVFALFLFLLYPFLEKVIKIDVTLLILMCLIFFFQPAYNFWISRQRYEYKYKFSLIWSIIIAVISPLTAVVCILLFKDNKLYARLFGAEIPLIMIYVLFYIYLAIKSKLHIGIKYWKAAIMFNLPLIPHYLSTYLLNSSDKLMISYLVSDSATAYYSVAYSVAAVATIVWTAINSSLIPFTYEKYKDKNYVDISKVTSLILTAFSLICLVVIMLAPEVVAIMATSDYREAIYVIPPIVGGVFFQVQYNIYGNIVYYYKRPKYVMYASVTSAVLNIILNYIFIQYVGYIAAGYTTLVCYLVQAVLDYFAMKKITNDSVYNMKYIMLLSLCVILVALISNLLYDLMLIRYLILLVVFVVVICNRKKLTDILKALTR